MADKLFAGLTYEQTVERFKQTVAGVCVMRLQNFADAEDCFQNVFIKLYYKSPEFKTEEYLKAWLIRVSINECNSLSRARRTFIPLEKVKGEGVCLNEDSADLSWALMKTPKKYRDVLYLFYLEGYKIKEISEILGIKENTVKTLLKRGKEKLKAIYGGDEV